MRSTEQVELKARKALRREKRAKGTFRALTGLKGHQEPATRRPRTHILLKRDPSKTKTIRDRWVREMNKRFMQLRKNIKISVDDHDVFGLREPSPILTPQHLQVHQPLGPQAFKFNTDAEKIEKFSSWLQEEAEKGILTAVPIPEGVGPQASANWMNFHIESGYKKGMERSLRELEKAGTIRPSEIPIQQRLSVEAMFMQPIHAERVGSLYTRAFKELKGITDAMDHQISRSLAESLAEGRGPAQMARILMNRVEKVGTLAMKDSLGRFVPALRRARILARTETIRAHHVGLVQVYREAGVEGVIVMAEWGTALDDRVCPECSALEGKVFTLDQIEPMIPLHPQCRCVAIPKRRGFKPKATPPPAAPIITPPDEKPVIPTPVPPIPRPKPTSRRTAAPAKRVAPEDRPQNLPHGFEEPEHMSFAADDAIKVDGVGGIDFVPDKPSQFGGLTKELHEDAIRMVKGKQRASGVIIIEDNGSVWIREPRGHYGGVRNSFPKGKHEKGLTLQENAIKETFEETGLVPEIVGHLGDFEGKSSVTRMYVGIRRGGTPYIHDAESSLVKLVQMDDLQLFFNSRAERQMARKLLALSDEAWALSKKNKHPFWGNLLQLLNDQDKARRAVTKVAVAELPNNVTTADDFGKRLTTTGERPGGSTGAQVYVDDEGTEWIVKSYNGNEMQAQNEWVANRLYAANSISVPEARLARIDGRLAIASKRIKEKGLVQMGSAHVDDAAKIAAAKKGFVTDAWLANWDVAGLDFDNIMLVPGSKQKVFRIDQGGSLLFRAQGTSKGGAFGAEVSELMSLRNPGTNSQAARFFAEISDEVVAKQIGTLSNNIKRGTLDAILNNSGMSAEFARELSELMWVRYNYLRRWQASYRKANKAPKVLPRTVDKIEDPDVPLLKEEYDRVVQGRANGRSVQWDAGDIEDQQLLMWVEGEAGKRQTMASFKIRPGPAQIKIDKMVSRPASKEKSSIFGREGWGDAVTQPEDIVSLNSSMLEAIKGVRHRLSTTGSLDEKDIKRIATVRQKLRILKKQMKGDIAAGRWKKADLSDIEKWFDPWYESLAFARELDVWEPPANLGWAKFRNFVLRDPIVKKEAVEKVVGPIVFKPVKSPFTRANFSKGHISSRADLDDVTKGLAEVFRADIDDVAVYYLPGGDTNKFAFRDQVLMISKGEELKAGQKMLDVLEKLGIKKGRPTALDMEELYLTKIANARFKSEQWGDFKAASRSTNQEKKIADMKKFLSDDIGQAVDKLPDYNPQGELQAFENGRRVWYRPDLGMSERDKLAGYDWATFEKDYHLHHQLYGDLETTIEKMLDNGGQLLSTTEKMRKGIHMGGQSPIPDLDSGGADYVFTRVRRRSTSLADEQEGIYFKAKALKRTDAISYNSDNYGKVISSQYIREQRENTISRLQKIARRDSNETIIKRTMSIFDDLDFIKVDNLGEQERLIQIFRDAGFSKWPDGRSLTEVVKYK